MVEKIEEQKGLEKQLEEATVAQRMMGDFKRPSIMRTLPSITRPTVDATNFKFKPNVIKIVQ